MKLSALVLLVCFSFSGFSPLFTKGIDLVALKKQEEERRKKISKSKQVVTDANLNKVSGGGKSYGFVQMEPEEPAAEENVSGAAKNENQNDEKKQSDFWKKQQIDLETKIAELKEGIAGGQNELNKLWSDFYIKNIPAEQDAIKVQISQLTNQIEQKKLFLSQAESELEDLFEKARKAGVPPGWLR
jgi:hypothetical protein